MMNKLFENAKQYCPQCGGVIIIRNGSYGLFKGCADYPKCNYIEPLKKGYGHIVKTLDDVLCPRCQQKSVLRQGPFGMYIACIAYPDECQFTRQIKQSEQTQVNCPSCQKGHLIQRQSRFGKKFYACCHYPSCKFIIHTKPIKGTCSFCLYPLLTTKKIKNDSLILCANKACGKKQ